MKITSLSSPTVQQHVKWELNLKLPYSTWSDKNKRKFYHSFTMLLNAGIDIKTSLEMLLTQDSGKNWKKGLRKIYSGVLAGSSLSAAMKNTEQFSAYELASIQIGEESGYLPQIIASLQHHFTSKQKLKRLIVSTFSYPVLVLFLSFGTLYFMLTYVVPMFSNIFKRFNQELPALTQYIMQLADWVGSKGIIVIGTFLLGTLIHLLLMRWIPYRENFGEFLLKVPFIGETIRKTTLARFTMAMSFLTHSGTPLTKSLDLSQQMIEFYPLKKALRIIRSDLEKGSEFYQGLTKFSIFPTSFVTMIRIAESVNQLDEMFKQLSQQYSEELEHQTKVLSKVLEPLLIIFVGSIVGIILIAMYLPLFNLSSVL